MNNNKDSQLNINFLTQQISLPSCNEYDPASVEAWVRRRRSTDASCCPPLTLLMACSRRRAGTPFPAHVGGVPFLFAEDTPYWIAVDSPSRWATTPATCGIGTEEETRLWTRLPLMFFHSELGAEEVGDVPGVLGRDRVLTVFLH